MACRESAASASDRRETNACHVVSCTFPAGRKALPRGEAWRYDQKALALAAEVLSATVRTDQANAIVQPIFEQMENYYAARDAHAAALTGLEGSLKLPVSRENRVRGLRLVAASKIALANEWVQDQARLGKLPDAVQFPASPPPQLMGAVEALRAIWKENPGEGIWQQQLQLAANTQALAKTIPWPEKIDSRAGRKHGPSNSRCSVFWETTWTRTSRNQPRHS